MTALREPLRNPGLLVGGILALAGIATMILGSFWIGVSAAVVGLIVVAGYAARSGY
jgi:hypothetical protein